MTKQLTVAVPSYNVEAYLERGLESYSDPRLADDLEVVIVDDGSTDGTAAIARRFVDAAPDVFRLVSKENGGHGSAVNAGLAAATGRYFRVIDGDDWVDPDGLAAELAALRSIDSDIVVDVRRDVSMASGDTELRPLPAEVPTGGELPFSTVADLAARTSVITIHTLVGRTDFLRSCGIGLLEHTFYVDTEFVVKATAEASTVTFLDVEVYQYLVGNPSQSVAAGNYVKRFDDHDRVVREVCRFVDERVSSGTLPEAIDDYLRLRAKLLVHTHYNVMLVYDDDRARGRRRAKEFRSWLAEAHPDLRRATDRRYFEGIVAGLLGLGASAMDRIMGRMDHEADGS